MLLVSHYLIKISNTSIHKQMSKSEISKFFNTHELDNLDIKNDKKDADKRFDFVFKYENVIFLAETNFYASSGSKLNEVSRSYEKLADEINRLNNFKFIWMTDGIGWRDAKNILRESHQHQEFLVTIYDLENGNLLESINEYLNAK